MNRVAAVFLASWAVAGTLPARGAFEFRPGQPGGSALLPPALIAPFGFETDARNGFRWSIGTLHLCPYGEEGLSYDAFGGERVLGGGYAAARLARLAAPGYSEWDLSAGWRARNGPQLEASFLTVASSPRLRALCGVAPFHGGSLCGGFARVLGERFRVLLWVRDGLRSRGCAEMGIEPVPVLKAEMRAGAWLVSATREWQAGGASFNASIRWSPLPQIRLERGWGGDSSVFSVSCTPGRLSGQAWKGDSGEGLWTTGTACALSGAKASPRSNPWPEADSKPEAKTEPEANPNTRGSGSCPAGAPRPERPREQGRPVEEDEDLWAEGDSSLRLDEGYVAESVEADSLGEWSDSLQCERAQRRAEAGGPPERTERGDGALPGRGARFKPRALDSLDASVLCACGISMRVAEELGSVLRRCEAWRLSRIQLAPELRRALVRAAPYLTARDNPSSRGWSSSGMLPISRSRGGGTSITLSRSSTVCEGKPRRGTGSVELRRRTAGVDLSGRWHLRGNASPAGGWVAAGRSWTILQGEGARPVSWGVGLLTRSRAADLRASPRLGGARGLHLPSPLLLPGGSGSRAVLGGEVAFSQVGLRAAFAREGSSAWMALRGGIGDWTAGLLERVSSEEGDARGIWLSRRVQGQETSVEAAVIGTRVLWGMRWAGGRARPGVFRLAWWDLLVRERLSGTGDPSFEIRCPEEGVLFTRQARCGLQSSVGSAVAALQWSARARASGRTEHTGSCSVRASGRAPALAWALQGNGISRRTDHETSSGTSSSTARIRATLARGGDRATSASELLWWVEGGDEESRRSSSGAAGRRRGGGWIGFALGRRFTKTETTAGIVEVDCAGDYRLNLSPCWIAGSRLPFRGRGLWAAAGTNTELAGATATARIVVPWRVRGGGTSRAATSWEIRLRAHWERNRSLERRHEIEETRR